MELTSSWILVGFVTAEPWNSALIFMCLMKSRGRATRINFRVESSVPDPWAQRSGHQPQPGTLTPRSISTVHQILIALLLLL